MKGGPAREEKLKFLIRGGLFWLLFCPNKKVREEALQSKAH